jgi:hypothetical protein
LPAGVRKVPYPLNINAITREKVTLQRQTLFKGIPKASKAKPYQVKHVRSADRQIFLLSVVSFSSNQVKISVHHLQRLNLRMPWLHPDQA